MAYAQASGLPPVTGLYATVVPLVVYAAVGPSRVLVLGPDSALVPMIVAALVPWLRTTNRNPWPWRDSWPS
ncbi:probable sulfate transporter Rv1739c/MT1781 [Arthrobacter sp. Hiyo4]|nr:probable sulfate transporter Rv1739c/MT1781 [Arthrobacter sp. Hiyo4]